MYFHIFSPTKWGFRPACHQLVDAAEVFQFDESGAQNSTSPAVTVPAILGRVACLLRLEMLEMLELRKVPSAYSGCNYGNYGNIWQLWQLWRLWCHVLSNYRILSCSMNMRGCDDHSWQPIPQKFPLRSWVLGCYLYSLHSCQHIFLHSSWPDQLYCWSTFCKPKNKLEWPKPSPQIDHFGASIFGHATLPLAFPATMLIVAVQVQVPATTVSWIKHHSTWNCSTPSMALRQNRRPMGWISWSRRLKWPRTSQRLKPAISAAKVQNWRFYWV